MKNSRLSFVVGGLLLLLFMALLFCFQVRNTEVAVVTTFGRYSRDIADPGLYFRLPVPIQSVYRFDNRLQNFERKFEQSTTRDARNLLVTMYVGWRIESARKFLELFGGDTAKAENTLEGLVSNAKNAVIGRYVFSDLISPDPNAVKFDQFEADVLKEIAGPASEKYGIKIELVGVKQLGLPEAITGKVFERMRAERDRLVKQYQGEGNARAQEIRSEADRKRDEVLAKARADALRVMGEADAQASKELAILEKNPGLAVFLYQVNALKESLRERTTLFLDQKTAPFNLLSGDRSKPTANP
ncbi:MAG: Modulator of FtsH protease HflC [Verrucomicrobiota bacterium]